MKRRSLPLVGSVTLRLNLSQAKLIQAALEMYIYHQTRTHAELRRLHALNLHLQKAIEIEDSGTAR
jgi:hypothetical protein